MKMKMMICAITCLSISAGAFAEDKEVSPEVKSAQKLFSDSLENMVQIAGPALEKAAAELAAAQSAKAAAEEEYMNASGFKKKELKALVEKANKDLAIADGKYQMTLSASKELAKTAAQVVLTSMPQSSGKTNAIAQAGTTVIKAESADGSNGKGPAGTTKHMFQSQ